MKNFQQFLAKSKRIFAFFKPYWRMWFFLFFISLILSALALVDPLIIKFLIDKVILAKNFNLLKILMLVYITITFFAVSIKITSQYFYQKLELTILYDIRNRLFSCIEGMGIDFFERKKVGDLLTRLDSDINSIEEFISLIFNDLLSNFLKLLALLAISLYLNWQITLTILIVIPFYIISQYFYGKKLKSLNWLIKHQSAGLMSFLEEKLSAMTLIQLFGCEDRELQRERYRAKRLIKTNLRATFMSSWSEATIEFLTFSALLFVLGYGGYQVMIGILTLGSLVALYSYLSKLFSPIESFIGFYTEVQGSLASIDRVFQILDKKPSVREKINAPLMPPIRGYVEFQNVSFKYGSDWVLKNINLTVLPGEVVGIVGESGNGKTTLINHISRLYDPVEGDVLIDGHNLKDVDLQSLRRQIGVAAQHVTLFNTSIKENICYGQSGKATQKEIKAVAKEVLIEEVIEKLPHKYKTHLGERGMTLSGGERQRLAIARLILKNPNIVILDETTSFLDFKTELAVMQNLRRIFAGKTMFIIAHRLGLLEEVDRIIVLKNGSIVESGKFQELLDKKGDFFRLYNFQFGIFDRFHKKFSMELERSFNEKLPLSVVVIKIKNTKQLLQKLGEKYVLEMLNKINENLLEIATLSKFTGRDLNHKDIFYVILPETDKLAAEKFADRLTSRLCKKFENFEIDTKINFASKNLETAEKMLLW